MDILIFILIIVISIYIFFEDIKFRKVTWILFPLLGVTGILYSSYQNSSIQIAFANAAFNCSLISIQVLFIFIYAKLRQVKISRLVGIGDLLFIIAVSLFFSPVNFLIYLVISLAFSLLLHLLLLCAGLYPRNQSSVPLAGFQAIAFLLIVTATKINPDINIQDDTWMIYKLQRI